MTLTWVQGPVDFTRQDTTPLKEAFRYEVVRVPGTLPNRPTVNESVTLKETAKGSKYYTCPECEANFESKSLVDGKFPPHRAFKDRDKQCPGVGQKALNEERDYTPRYTVLIASAGKRYTEASWDVKFRHGPVPSGPFKGMKGLGQPTDANLAKYVKDFESGTAEGGPNAHLGVTKITSAEIKDQQTKEIVARYRG